MEPIGSHFVIHPSCISTFDPGGYLCYCRKSGRELVANVQKLGMQGVMSCIDVVVRHFGFETLISSLEFGVK